ncbi:MAG: histidine phosphatase family protein [Candidatus Pacebacteria bacterium]|nr:histidine phosphatase family protein [Candidatus Paceibacterota bacterium]MBP9780496.1 histidine phosphatase family protein [Candidatus Paceibacterota bacterium]
MGNMPKNLILVRHGQSEGNAVQKEFENSGDDRFFSEEFLSLHESQYALTELGIEQAKKAGRWLIENELDSFDRYYVSNNVRALQTAAYLGLKNASWYNDFNLRERDGGLFHTITPSKRDESYADQQKFYNTQPFLFRPPQGESIADVCQRVQKVLETLARECGGKNVIIVCHGHVMRTFRIVLERMSLDKANKYLSGTEEWARVPNCSIIHYTREDPSTGLLNAYLNHVRMIRPTGGGLPIDQWQKIERVRFSNEDLLEEAERNRVITA